MREGGKPHRFISTLSKHEEFVLPGLKIGADNARQEITTSPQKSEGSGSVSSRIHSSTRDNPFNVIPSSPRCKSARAPARVRLCAAPVSDEQQLIENLQNVSALKAQQLDSLTAQMLSKRKWSDREACYYSILDLISEAAPKYTYTIKQLGVFLKEYVLHLKSIAQSFDSIRAEEMVKEAVAEAVSALEVEISELREEREKLLLEGQNQASVIENLRVNLLGTVDALCSDREASRRKAEEGDKKVHQSRESVHALEEQIRALTHDIVKLSKKASWTDELQDHNDALIREVKGLKEQLNVANSNHTNVAHTQRLEIQELRVKLSMSSVMCKNLKSKNSDYMSNIAKLQEKLTDAEKRLFTLQQTRSDQQRALTPRPNWDELFDSSKMSALDLLAFLDVGGDHAEEDTVDVDEGVAGEVDVQSTGRNSGRHISSNTYSKAAMYRGNQLNEDNIQCRQRLSKLTALQAFLDTESQDVVTDIWMAQGGQVIKTLRSETAVIPRFLKCTQPAVQNLHWTKSQTVNKIHQLFVYIDEQSNVTGRWARKQNGELLGDYLWSFIQAFNVGVPNEKMAEVAYNMITHSERYGRVEPICKMFLLVLNNRLPLTLYEAQNYTIRCLSSQLMELDSNKQMRIHRRVFTTALRQFFQGRDRIYVCCRNAAFKDDPGNQTSYVRLDKVLLNHDGVQSNFIRTLRKLMIQELILFYEELEQVLLPHTTCSKIDHDLILISLSMASRALFQAKQSEDKSSSTPVSEPTPVMMEDLEGMPFSIDDMSSGGKSSPTPRVASASTTRSKPGRGSRPTSAHMQAVPVQINPTQSAYVKLSAKTQVKVFVHFKTVTVIEEGDAFTRLAFPKHADSVGTLLDKASQQLERYSGDHVYWKKRDTQFPVVSNDYVSFDALMSNIRSTLVRPECILKDLF